MPTPWVSTTDTARFEQDVVEASKRVPVLLDFTAAWCGPCQELGPVLEKLAEEFAGKFQLLKIDLDQNMALAQEFGVESIPAVYAFKDGQPLARFVGALPEEQIREFLKKILPSAAEERLAKAEELMTVEPAKALALLSENLQANPNDDDALAVQARALLQLGKLEEAQAAAAAVTDGSPRYFLAQNVLTLIDLRRGAEAFGDAKACQDAVWKAPKDAEAHCRLGIVLAAQGEHAQALEELLKAAELDPKQARGAAKAAMLQLFQVLGSDSDLVGDYRSKLASLLY